MTELLVQFGYIGMFISALLAGSVLPFNSEVVIGALKVAGLDPWWLLISGTVGNVLGGLFNYWIGTFGRMDWIENNKGAEIHGRTRSSDGILRLRTDYRQRHNRGSRTHEGQHSCHYCKHDGRKIPQICHHSVRNTDFPIEELD